MPCNNGQKAKRTRKGNSKETKEPLKETVTRKLRSKSLECQEDLEMHKTREGVEYLETKPPDNLEVDSALFKNSNQSTKLTTENVETFTEMVAAQQDYNEAGGATSFPSPHNLKNMATCNNIDINLCTANMTQNIEDVHSVVSQNKNADKINSNLLSNPNKNVDKRCTLESMDDKVNPHHDPKDDLHKQSVNSLQLEHVGASNLEHLKVNTECEMIDVQMNDHSQAIDKQSQMCAGDNLTEAIESQNAAACEGIHKSSDNECIHKSSDNEGIHKSSDNECIHKSSDNEGIHKSSDNITNSGFISHQSATSLNISFSKSQVCEMRFGKPSLQTTNSTTGNLTDITSLNLDVSMETDLDDSVDKPETGTTPASPPLVSLKRSLHSPLSNSQVKKFKPPCQKYIPDQNSSTSSSRHDRNWELKPQNDHIFGIQHQENILGIQHQDNILRIQHQDNILSIQHQENILGIQHQENILGIQHQENILRIQHQENILGIQHQANILSIQHQENILGIQHQDNILSIQHQENILGIQHQDNILGIQHQDNILRIEHQENTLGIQHPDNILSIQNQDGSKNEFTLNNEAAPCIIGSEQLLSSITDIPRHSNDASYELECLDAVFQRPVAVKDVEELLAKDKYAAADEIGNEETVPQGQLIIKAAENIATDRKYPVRNNEGNVDDVCPGDLTIKDNKDEQKLEEKHTSTTNQKMSILMHDDVKTQQSSLVQVEVNEETSLTKTGKSKQELCGQSFYNMNTDNSINGVRNELQGYQGCVEARNEDYQELTAYSSCQTLRDVTQVALEKEMAASSNSGDGNNLVNFFSSISPCMVNGETRGQDSVKCYTVESEVKDKEVMKKVINLNEKQESSFMSTQEFTINAHNNEDLLRTEKVQSGDRIPSFPKMNNNENMPSGEFLSEARITDMSSEKRIDIIRLSKGSDSCHDKYNAESCNEAICSQQRLDDEADNRKLCGEYKDHGDDERVCKSNLASTTETNNTHGESCYMVKSPNRATYTYQNKGSMSSQDLQCKAKVNLDMITESTSCQHESNRSRQYPFPVDTQKRDTLQSTSLQDTQKRDTLPSTCLQDTQKRDTLPSTCLQDTQKRDTLQSTCLQDTQKRDTLPSACLQDTQKQYTLQSACLQDTQKLDTLPSTCLQDTHKLYNPQLTSLQKTSELNNPQLTSLPKTSELNNPQSSCLPETQKPNTPQSTLNPDIGFPHNAMDTDSISYRNYSGKLLKTDNSAIEDSINSHNTNKHVSPILDRNNRKDPVIGKDLSQHNVSSFEPAITLHLSDQAVHKVISSNLGSSEDNAHFHILNIDKITCDTSMSQQQERRQHVNVQALMELSDAGTPATSMSQQQERRQHVNVQALMELSDAGTPATSMSQQQESRQHVNAQALMELSDAGTPAIKHEASLLTYKIASVIMNKPASYLTTDSSKPRPVSLPFTDWASGNSHRTFDNLDHHLPSGNSHRTFDNLDHHLPSDFLRTSNQQSSYLDSEKDKLDTGLNNADLSRASVTHSNHYNADQHEVSREQPSQSVTDLHGMSSMLQCNSLSDQQQVSRKQSVTDCHGTSNSMLQYKSLSDQPEASRKQSVTNCNGSSNNMLQYNSLSDQPEASRKQSVTDCHGSSNSMLQYKSSSDQQAWYKEQRSLPDTDSQTTSNMLKNSPVSDSLMDLSDSQICQLATEDFDNPWNSDLPEDMDETENLHNYNFEQNFRSAQTKSAKEIEKRKAEGKKLVDEIMYNIVSLNKQLLRMKREMETVRRVVQQQQHSKPGFSYNSNSVHGFGKGS